MTKTSLKALLGGAAVAIVATIAVAPAAHATCWWAGGDWNCTTPPPPGSVIAPAPAPTDLPGMLPPGNSGKTGMRYPGPKAN